MRTIVLAVRGFSSRNLARNSPTVGRHDAFDLAVSQLGLGLAFELRVRDAHRDDGGQPFAEVVAAGYQILEDVFLLAVVVQRPRQGGAEAGDVRAAFDGVDVVHVRMHVLGEFGRVLHGDVVTDPVGLAGQVDHLGMQRVAGPVQVLDELHDAAFVAEFVAFVHPLVAEADPHAAVQEREFLQPFAEGVEGELGGLEDRAVRFERGFRAAFLRGADAFHLADRHTPLVLLLVDMAGAIDFDLAPLRQEVDDGDADAVQAAGRLIGALFELAAEFQHAHDAFQRRDLAAHLLGELVVDIDRDAAAIVLDGHRAVGIDGDGDALGETGHGFVDRVVHDFVDQVVQPAGSDVADVHRGALAARGPCRTGAAGRRRCILRRLVPGGNWPGIDRRWAVGAVGVVGPSWSLLTPLLAVYPEFPYADAEVADFLVGCQPGELLHQLPFAKREFLHDRRIPGDHFQDSATHDAGLAVLGELRARGLLPGRLAVRHGLLPGVATLGHQPAQHVRNGFRPGAMPLAAADVAAHEFQLVVAVIRHVQVVLEVLIRVPVRQTGWSISAAPTVSG